MAEHDSGLPGIIEECVRCWRKRELAGLAGAVTGGQFFPLLKRGLGRSNACTPVLTWLRTAETVPPGNGADAQPAKQQPAE